MRRLSAARFEVRISAGRWKGRPLEVPPGARPTSGRAREALFDLLGERVLGARVLDLYAGSGAVGLEAVSRGAAVAVLVDRDTSAIERTCQRLQAHELITVRTGDAGDVARELLQAKESFDIVFVDSPYGALEGSPRMLPRFGELVSAEGVLVVQTDAGGPGLALDGFEVVDRRTYGRNVFQFLCHPGVAPTQGSS